MIPHYLDTNGDGVINADDCGFIHGSLEAKVWWQKVEAYSKSQAAITPQMKVSGFLLPAS